MTRHTTLTLHHHRTTLTRTRLPVNQTSLISGLIDADIHHIVITATPPRRMLAFKNTQRFAYRGQTQRRAERFNTLANRIVGYGLTDHGTGTARTIESTT